jgi:hypothetical protein
MLKVHCSYVLQQTSWHSDRQSSLDLARPSESRDVWHPFLQSEIDLKKSGSFLVPLVSPDFFFTSPGSTGDFPEMYFVPGGRGASAAKTAGTAAAPIKQKFIAATFKKRRLVFWIWEFAESDDISSIEEIAEEEWILVSWEWLKYKIRENLS